MGYTDKTIEHAQHPRNVGYLEQADGTGTAGDPNCGDFAIMTVQVRGGRIQSCRFLVRGCSAAIATCSITTEMAEGKSLAEAERITDQMVDQALGGLPPEKLHCSNLAAGALHAALADYRQRHRTTLSDWRSLYQR